jgi:flagellar hook-associated protein 3 FlgL
MRIATSQMFDRPTAQMATLTQRADAIQTQVATGTKFRAPSDDAAAFLRLDSLKRASADDTSYAANIKLAQGLLAQTDGTLESVETQLQRAQELTLQAANGTLSDANRSAIAATLSAIGDDLLALADTRDSRGQPLFDAGDPAAIPIGQGNSVYATVSRERAFGDMIATIRSLSDALAAGGDVSQAASQALAGIETGLDGVTAARASAGARAVRLDLEADRLSDVALQREESRSAIEDTDIPAAIAELQKTLTVLQATQASFTKLSGLSLFDYLR